jgi:hypothetical protein
MNCEQWDMPKIATWTTSPHLRGGNADEPLLKSRNSSKTNLLAYCHCQHISARARQMINTLTDCHGISDVFNQRGSYSRGSTHSHTVKRSATCSVSEVRTPDDQDTHILSRDQRCVRSARLELRGSTHSHTVKRPAMCSVS